MNKIEELEMKLKELSEEIERLKAEEENGVWKPKDGEWYWFIAHSGGEISTVWRGDAVDEIRYEVGNVFRTQEEAEFRAEQLKVETELRQFGRKFVLDEDNYSICFSHPTNDIYTLYEINEQFTNIYFDSEEIAQKAIETVGEERIKKYYFGVEE